MANFVLDTFTDTNGVPLLTHVGETGATWTLQNGGSTAAIQSNRIQFTASPTVFATFTPSGTTPGGDEDITQDVFVASTNGLAQFFGRFRNVSGNDRFYVVQFDISGLVLQVRPSGTGGSDVTIGTYSFTPNTSQNYNIRMTLSGSTQIVYLDGVPVITGANSQHTGATGDKIGILFFAASGVVGFEPDKLTGGPNLIPGTTTATPTGSTTATVSNTAAVGDTGTYTAQYQRAPDSGGVAGAYANVGSAQAGITLGVAPSDLSDTGLSSNTTYWYRLKVTYSADSTILYTSGVSATTTGRSAGNFFISATGSDGNDGLTTSTPWQTITKVNTNGYVPGDTISFKGGDAFLGNMLVAPGTQPGVATRIVISSYGTGNATIAGGNTYAIKLSNCGYITIKNLTLTGTAYGSSGTYPTRTVTTTATSGTAVLMLETTTASPYRSGIIVDSLTITGGFQGIQVGSTFGSGTTQVYDTLQISNCTVHDSAWGGIIILGAVDYSTSGRLNKFIRVSDCNVYNIPGVTGVSGGSGFPIFAFCATDVTFERCVAHHYGDAQNLSAGNGTVGFMFVHSTRGYMRSCEAYDAFAPQNIDGSAFDFDADCTNCVIEYCYGHDTDGPVMFLWNDDGGATSSTGSAIRYNIFVNGGRDTANYGTGIHWNGNVGSALVYNNVFYNAKPGTSTGLLGFTNSSNNIQFYNNIFAVTGGQNFGTANSATFFANVYNVRAGSTFSLTTTSGTYTTIAALRVAGYETFNGLSVGVTGDPVWTTPGDTTAYLPATPLRQINAWNLGVNSAARGAGVNLSTVVGTQFVPSFDFHGNQATSTPTPAFTGIDSGPVAYGSAYVPSGGGGGTGGGGSFSFSL